MNEAQVEQEIQEKGLTAPRLTPAAIDAAIWGCKFWNPEGTTLTVCAMQLQNGMMVVGESACVSPENFDIEIGKQLAYDNARDKIWVLEGYLLREALHSIQTIDDEADRLRQCTRQDLGS
jgi:hypothetical protein